MSTHSSEHDQRTCQRNAASGYFRVRTAGSMLSFKGELRDLSRSGAFIRTTIFPELDEAVTVEILDLHDQLQMICKGKVARIDRSCRICEYGFAIHFNEFLPADIEHHLTDE